METQSTLEWPQQEGLLVPVLVLPLSSRKEAEGRNPASAGGRAMIALSSSRRGFMRALAITTTICCAG